MSEHFDSSTASSLVEALDATAPEVSVRLNPRKLSSAAVLQCRPDAEPVPWCPDAFYLPERPAFTFDPLLHAGAYYVQEASSMYVAEVVRQFAPTDRPLRALDLCAAPGGKTTLLQSLLPEGSTLICNEPNHKRFLVLSENVDKWMLGQPDDATHCLLTQRLPHDFGEETGRIDLLLTDVPCSGEGMFRKDDGARREWSLENVRMCQRRQREILLGIWPVLKPGGLLIYSTCTFNRYEDEDNARWICQELGASLLHERHFLPGRDRGEGFYIATMEKRDGLPGTFQGRGEASGWSGVPRQDGLSEAFRVELNYREALQYLRREALRVEAPRGLVALCYRGLMLGPGKGVGSRINNLYPEQWRIRTTYTTPFSLLPIID